MSLPYALSVMDLDKLLSALGGKIRTIRKTKKISQEKLAELSGLHPTYISDIERGKVNASIYSFYVVANALGIPFSELVSLPSDKADKRLENELTALVGLARNLDKKKQSVFLSAAKGLISGLEGVQ